MQAVQKAADYPAISRPAGWHNPAAGTRIGANNTSQASGCQLVAYALQPGGSLFSAVARAAAQSGNTAAKPMTTAIEQLKSCGFSGFLCTSVSAHKYLKLIEDTFLIKIDNLKIMHSCMIINGNNTSQAYGQCKLTTLKPGGFFFLGAE